jgi:hypothetical protein
MGEMAMTPEQLLAEWQAARKEYRLLDDECTAAWRAKENERTPAKDAYNNAREAKEKAFSKMCELQRQMENS